MSCSRGLKSSLQRLQITARGKGRLSSPKAKSSIPAGTGVGYAAATDEQAQSIQGPASELYRVVSKIVTDPSGNWEFPVNFPTSNTYPGFTDGPDQSVYMVSERTHELGLIDEDGNVRYVLYPTGWEQPFAGNTSYNPVFTFIRVTTPPQEFADQINRVDWQSIQAAAAGRWQGLT